MYTYESYNQNTTVKNENNAKIYFHPSYITYTYLNMKMKVKFALISYEGGTD